MNIRLIAGTYGGRKLTTPNTARTHPMSERVRNAMFNNLNDLVKDAAVLDAFAGSGAVGLEALSRGAGTVVFVERDRVAQRVLQENIALLGTEAATKIIKASVTAFVSTYDGELFDLIFADPPYKDEQFSTVLSLFPLLKPGGTMVLSHPGRGERPIQNNEIVVVDNRSYGNACLTFFRRVE